MPFHHMDILPNDTLKPCCKFLEELPYDNIENKIDVHRDVFFENIRNSLKQGITVKGCQQCYDSEQHSNKSFRTRMLDKFKERTGKEFEMPDTSALYSINIALSNLCNSKCRMCSPEYSTSWYSDAKKLGIQIPKGPISKNDIIDSISASSLYSLSFVGGEPMMEQERIIKLLKQCNLENLNFIVTTNGTLLPNSELVSLLKKCKNVEIDLSIDTYGKLNDFLRKGGQWDNINYNLNWYYNNFPKIKMNTAISIYNINLISELLNYISEYFPNVIHNHLIVSKPDWMSPKNLPESVKDLVRKKIENIEIPEIGVILNEMSKRGNYENFKNMDLKLNNVRNEDWKHLNTELTAWLNNF